MNGSRIDRFSRQVARAIGRRRLIVGLGAAVAGGALGANRSARAQDEHENECPCGWENVYESDPGGGPASGSFALLVDRVTAGADLKVAYSRPSDTAMTDWFRTCTSASVARNASLEAISVSCLILDIPDSNLDAAGSRFFVEPFAVEWQAYNTTGQRHVVKFNAVSHAVEEKDFDNLPLSWFVRR